MCRALPAPSGLSRLVCSFLCRRSCVANFVLRARARDREKERRPRRMAATAATAHGWVNLRVERRQPNRNGSQCPVHGSAQLPPQRLSIRRERRRHFRTIACSGAPEQSSTSEPKVLKKRIQISFFLEWPILYADSDLLLVLLLIGARF